MSDVVPEARKASSVAVLRAAGVDVVRGGRALLHRVSFTVHAGEHWALLGPNGAGKSTLLRLLATYLFPTSGQVEILGRRLGTVDVFTIRPQVAIVTPHHPLNSARTAREIVLTGVTGTIEPAARWTPTAADHDRAAELSALMGVGDLADARWNRLSQGERNRTLIARALMARPRVLLLDEPTAGLDLAGREQLLAGLGELRHRQPDVAVMLVTHHLEELPATTSHAILLRDGQQLAAGRAAEVLTSDLVSACFSYPVSVSSNAGRWVCAARSG